MGADRAIIHTVMVAVEVETSLSGHRHQVLGATVLGTQHAKVFDGDSLRHSLQLTDNRVVRTRRWLERNLKGFRLL